MSAASPPIRYDSNHSLVVSLDTPSRRASDLAPIPSRINPTTILIYSTSYEPLRFRDIENRTSKSSDMNYSSPTIGVRFTCERRGGLLSVVFVRQCFGDVCHGVFFQLGLFWVLFFGFTVTVFVVYGEEVACDDP